MTSLSEPRSLDGRKTAAPLRRRLFNRYLAGVFLATGLLSAGAVVLNSVIDPLWFWRGNLITGQNYIFNERVAKVNLILQAPEKYDCLIFGSSRVTLFDQTDIAGHRCANLAFSAGKAVEFLAYARYLADRGIRPRLVIVGVDDFNFLTKTTRQPEIPDFVRKGEAPPGWLESYLSLTALDFSQRTLREVSPMPRFYNDGFVGGVLKDTAAFKPPKKLKAAVFKGRLDPQRADLYRQLRDTFPEARFWGFVPPVAAWKVTETRHLGKILDGYLQAIANTAEHFEVLYDFSVPSAVTRRHDNTYDGSHYYPAVHKVISERLQTASPQVPADSFGLPVHAMTLGQYEGAFKAALNRFLAAEFPDLHQAEIAQR